ncbi:hypothetical protein V2I01_39450 [Micromonospora sp. BRA006-A]|nr:hypothetical protein [Micromonospora sp. BRA006-A]
MLRCRGACRGSSPRCAAALLVPPGTATAGPPRGPAPVVTRAGLDPALVAGRGATVDYVEQEAEHGRTTGTVIGPDRSAYTLAGEASGRGPYACCPASTSNSRSPGPRTR